MANMCRNVQIYTKLLRIENSHTPLAHCRLNNGGERCPRGTNTGGSLLPLQPSQPLPGILNLSNTRVSVFPEVEKFLVMLYGFPFPSLFFHSCLIITLLFLILAHHNNEYLGGIVYLVFPFCSSQLFLLNTDALI